MICGIDEAGRGPLAGPVTAAAVILPKNFDVSVLRDSKKLSAKKREQVRKLLFFSGKLWHIGWASNHEIDEINILQAALLAMRRAYEGLCQKIAVLSCLPEKPENFFQKIDVIVDGNKLPDILNCRSIKAVPKADDTVYEVMAASVLAKTARDKMMTRYSWLYPEYGYEKHKGYGTKIHLEAIRRFGVSPIQRKSFSVKIPEAGDI